MESKDGNIIEVFKYKAKEAQDRFKVETTQTTNLSKIIDTEKPLDVVTKKFDKRVKGFIHASFKKIRVVEQHDEKLEDLYNKRRILRIRKDVASLKELEDVDKELSEKYSESMFRKIMSEVKGVENSEEGGFNTGMLWKLNTKLSPRSNDPPRATYNSDGKLLPGKEDIFQ